MKFPNFNNFIQKLLIFFGGTDYDIFISYKRGEADLYGSALANYLTEKKYRCYFDQHVRDEGQDDLPVALKKAARNSTMLVILGTKLVDNSKWIRQEIETYNLRKKKNIIPVNFGNAENQNWFELVKIFHSPSESLENLRTGTPSSLILETITNSFNFKKRNERLQNRAIIIICAVIMVMTSGVVISRNIVGEAKAEIQKAESDKSKAIDEKTKAEEEGKLAKYSAEKFKNDAIIFQKQKKTAEFLANEAKKQQAELQTTNNQLQKQNETATKELENATSATKDAMMRYRSADSMAKKQENVADAYLLASNALQELDQNPTIALNDAKKAYSKHNSKMTMNVLYRCSINQNQYKEIEGIRGNEFMRFASSDMILNSNGKTLQLNKPIDNYEKNESVIRFDSLKSFDSQNIISYKKAKILIWYDELGSTIAILENKKISYRKLQDKIAFNYYNKSIELKIIDDSRIAFVDSARSSISVFDWRQNKTVSTFRLNEHKKLKQNEIGYMTVGNADTILFTIYDDTGLVKVYVWKWEKNEKPISTIFNDEALSITSIQMLRIGLEKYLCIGNSEGELSIWNTKKKLLSLPIHEGSIKRMETYRDTLITISGDNKIQVLKYSPPSSINEAGKVEKITTLKGHTNKLFDFDYNARNGLLISNDINSNLPAKLWQINIQQPLRLTDTPPISLFSATSDFIYDTEGIGKRNDENLSGYFYLIKDSLSLPFINSDNFKSVNLNSKKDILITCSKKGNNVYLFDTMGNRVDSLPLHRRAKGVREQYLSADFTHSDSLVVVVSNVAREYTGPIDHIFNDYIVYVYNRNWEEIFSFNINSNDKVIVWNDYLYKFSPGSYTRTLINPFLN